MLRRIDRIICNRCGRLQVTTWQGWHLCPSVDHDQARVSAPVWLAGLVALLGAMCWVLIRFWPV